MPQALPPPYSLVEIAQRGEDLYAEKVRPLVESDHHGERLVIDIETGNSMLESADEPLAAAHSLLQRNAHATLYRIRIGYPAATKIGGSRRSVEQ